MAKKLTFEIPDIKNIKLSSSKIMIVALIVMAFVIGMLYQKVQNLQAGAPVLGTTTGATPTTAQQPAGPTVTLDQIKALWSKDLIKLGDVNKKVLFVEVGDPSCPFCHVAAGLDSAVNKAANMPLVADGGTYVAPVAEIKKLVDSGKASFAYIYYPGHGNGEMGMKAMYCANEKGKFWQVHDLLMSEAGYQIMNGYDATQQPTKGPIVKNDKTQSGALATFLQDAIDPTFLKSCLDSGKYDSRLSADMQIASSLSVQGTPGFFVNSTPYAGAYSYTNMKPTVDAALK